MLRRFLPGFKNTTDAAEFQAFLQVPGDEAWGVRAEDRGQFQQFLAQPTLADWGVGPEVPEVTVDWIRSLAA